MATGRDASDVALTTSFGAANLTHFTVVSDWLDERAKSGIVGTVPATRMGTEL
jgi:hypothetical protein